MVNTSQPIVNHKENDYQFISVIVPIHNEEDALAVCLKSIKNQNYPQDNIEIIAIDDGSTDQSANIASTLGAKVMHQEHSGPGAARNRGTREASGAIVAFIDADDKAHENWLREIVPYFHEDGVDAVGCNHSLLNKINDFVKISWLERYFRISHSPEKVDHLGTSGCLYRKDTLERVGGFNCALLAAEDMDLASRVKKQGGILFLVKKPLIDVQYPSSWINYLRDQIKKSAYLILFRWKSRGTWGKIGNSYSGMTDYIQSLFLYAFLCGLIFVNLNYVIPIITGILLLLLIILNISFIGFVFKNRSKIELRTSSPFILLFYLIVRAISWSLGLAYGLVLILRTK